VKDTPTQSRTRLLPLACAFAVGLFTLGTQAALLREYLVLFRGSELGLGLFFGAWFLWVAAGASLSRRSGRVRAWIRPRLGLVLAAYPIGALLAIGILFLARRLASVPAFEPTPPGTVLFAALAATLPVSLLTGLSFQALATACGGSSRGACRAYAAEAFGAVAGGLLATLCVRYDGTALVAGAGLLLAGLSVFGANSRRERVAGTVVAVLLLAVLIPPAGPSLRRALSEARLHANLPAAELVEERGTDYRLVTVAALPGQTVVLYDGEVAESFPPGPDLDATAALLAAQPEARHRAVVFGDAPVGLARALARFFDRVDAVSLDGEAQAMLREAAGRVDTDRLAAISFETADPRAYAASSAGAGADLILVWAPDPGTLLTSRLSTDRFFQDLAAMLGAGGVMAVPVRSAENFAGPEIARFGQSVWDTVGEVFPVREVVPGDSALILAALRPGRLTLDPAALERRYRSFVPPGAPFRPDGFASRVQPDRQAFTRSLFEPPDKTGARLVNRDDHPLATFFGLLALLRESGSPGPRTLWIVFDTGPVLGLLFALVLALVIGRHCIRLAGPLPDATGELPIPAWGCRLAAPVLAAVSGGVSIAAFVALLAAYQSRIGAIRGEIGIATALGMAGMAAGSLLSARLSGGRIRIRAAVYCVGLSAILAALPAILAGAASLTDTGARLAFGGIFSGLGLVSGAAWPLAAALAGEDDALAATLESADHWGAAVLSAMTGTVLLGAWGMDGTFRVLAGLFVAPLVAVLLDFRSATGIRFLRSRPGRILAWPSLPYRLAPILASFLVLSGLVLVHAGSDREPGLETRVPAERLRRLDPFASERFESSPFDHHRLTGVRDPDQDAIVATTRAVAPDAKGWGGPFNLVLSIGDDGKVRAASVLAHHETPAYVHDLPAFLDRFRGRDIRSVFAVSGPGGVEGMTGATITTEAAVSALNRVREEVGRRILGTMPDDSPPGPGLAARLADPRAIFTVLALVGCVLVHFLAPGSWRLAWLAIMAVAGGAIFDLQLSSGWIQSLARGDLPGSGSNAPLFLLTSGVLALSLVFGPVYCAHLCPFGAIQEWAGKLGRLLRIHWPEPAALSPWARGLKYAMLVFVVLGLFRRDPESSLSWDPLSAVFSGEFGSPAWLVAGLAIAGSLVFERFWCRVFCPVGAFFALFNRVAALLGLGPARKYPACDLGVRGPADGECLQCNRCVRGG
jgi:hypothetical protein